MERCNPPSSARKPTAVQFAGERKATSTNCGLGKLLILFMRASQFAGFILSLATACAHVESAAGAPTGGMPAPVEDKPPVRAPAALLVICSLIPTITLAMTAPPAIELRDVGLRRDQRWILHEINWTVPAG